MELVGRLALFVDVVGSGVDPLLKMGTDLSHLLLFLKEFSAKNMVSQKVLSNLIVHILFRL